MFQKLVFVQHENENKAFSTLSHSYWLEAWFEGMDSSLLFGVKKILFFIPNSWHLETKGLEFYFVYKEAKNLIDLVVIFLPVSFLSLTDEDTLHPILIK